MLWQPLYIAWIVSEILIAVLTRTRRGGGAIQDRGTMLLLWITIFVSLTLSGFAEAYLPRMFPHTFRTFATMVLVLGLAIRLFAVFSLGKAFSANVAIRDAQQFKQTGLYKLVRHPSYLGLLLIFLAIGLHALNPLSLALAVLPTTAALLYRIHVEEIALVSAFGPAYKTYSAHTKRLVPWIY